MHPILHGSYSDRKLRKKARSIHLSHGMMVMSRGPSTQIFNRERDVNVGLLANETTLNVGMVLTN